MSFALSTSSSDAAFDGSAFPETLATRDGQITPSQERLRHLKSGAFGLRFESRLSHTRPPHFGQVGSSVASGPVATESSPAMSANSLTRATGASARDARLTRRAYTSAGSSSG